MPVTMKKAEVKSESKVVGVVEHPVFDEKNPDIGLEDILNYDWAPFGYASAKAAVVSLVTTQHATNLKNELRSKASGKLTGEKLSNLALAELAKLPPDQLAQLASTNSIAAKVEEFKVAIKAKHEEERKARIAANNEDDSSEE